KLENLIKYYEEKEFNNVFGDNNNSDDNRQSNIIKMDCQNNYSEELISNSHCQLYSYDYISYYIQLLLLTSIHNILIFIYINENSFKPNANLEKNKEKMPSERQISRWRQQRLQFYNYVYLAYCFSEIGYFSSSNNTLRRDGSSINGKLIEAIV